MSLVLAGDIGGTNCRLALCEWSGTSMMPAMTTLWSRTWRSRDHACLEDVVQGKLWAYRDPARRFSKRKKDELDLIRLAEAYPNLRNLLPRDLLVVIDRG